jgi:hypothetical protein
VSPERSTPAYLYGVKLALATFTVPPITGPKKKRIGGDVGFLRESVKEPVTP